jgi:hypothetical protein
VLRQVEDYSGISFITVEGGFDDWVINPLSRKRKTWDLCVVVFVLYNAVALPYVWAFVSSQSSTWVVFDYLIDVFFIADIFAAFRCVLESAACALLWVTHDVNATVVCLCARACVVCVNYVFISVYMPVCMYMYV